MFWNVLMVCVIKIFFCMVITIIGFCLDLLSKRYKEFRINTYFRKQRKRNKILTPVRASLERYYKVTQISPFLKKRRSREMCYYQCSRLLHKVNYAERCSLKAIYSSDLKAGETWGITLTAFGIFASYMVDAVAQLISDRTSKITHPENADTISGIIEFLMQQKDASANENIFATLIGLIALIILLLTTGHFVSGISKNSFFLSIINDVEKDVCDKKRNLSMDETKDEYGIVQEGE